MIFSNLSIYVFTKWKFSAIVSSNIFLFCPMLSLLNFWDSNSTVVRPSHPSHIVAWVPDALFSFLFNHFPLSTSDYSISTHPSSSSLTLWSTPFSLTIFCFIYLYSYFYYFLFNTNLRFYSSFSSFLR